MLQAIRERGRALLFPEKSLALTSRQTIASHPITQNAFAKIIKINETPTHIAILQEQNTIQPSRRVSAEPSFPHQPHRYAGSGIPHPRQRRSAKSQLTSHYLVLLLEGAMLLCEDISEYEDNDDEPSC